MPSERRDSAAEAQQHVSDLVDGVVYLKNKAKEKTKKLLDSADPSDPADHVSDDETDIFADAAFDPSKIHQPSSPKSKTSTHELVLNSAKDLKYVVLHPRRVARSQATRMAADKLANAKHPTLTIDRDQELLDAHDSLARATSNVSAVSDVDKYKSKVDDAEARIQMLEVQRDSLQTAWILGRHVSRTKVVRPIPRPRIEQFTTIVDGQRRVRWERYLGHLALYYTQGFTAPYIDDFESPPFDLEDLSRILERIAIVSAPWQSFLIDVRDVYMWNDPKQTMRWLALYSVLWYTQHVMGFFYFYIIYVTIRNRLRPSTVQGIRESVARSIDRGTRVQAWGELIQRHGKDDWLEPLLDELGPMIQLQLGDLANLLEALQNFYRWERPRLTAASLFLFSCCLLTTLVADMAFCMKLLWLIVGGVFFFSFPVSARWPQYRLLVSPVRWAFWDVPTHAELAIQNLQQKALLRDADMSEFELPQIQNTADMPNGSAHDETGDEEDQDEDEETQEQELIDKIDRSTESRSFMVYDKLHGRARLIVSRTGVTVHATHGPPRSWQFSDIAEMRKIDDVDVDSMLKNLKHVHSRSAKVLQFEFRSNNDLAEMDGTLTILLQRADRDRVFNLVLGWSGLRWQALMLERQKTKNEKKDRSNLDRSIKRAFI
ncbi:hypothetical protein A1O1_02407 [Capronia coronata CBS 617.96]|uniref:GRAM domain-containing protein n=1 Tax=Capronia coronata CBS 617.96 TaxID=1182541 RepID=W9ZHQ5_9EURO|nr:uncharacterized protein A1O1_02407 [Capronia coronata CBS 617.96]EXJ94014.1 hypothetical protein A1O1_02407 [Capronia coronata CBS 617.96]